MGLPMLTLSQLESFAKSFSLILRQRIESNEVPSHQRFLLSHFPDGGCTTSSRLFLRVLDGTKYRLALVTGEHDTADHRSLEHSWIEFHLPTGNADAGIIDLTCIQFSKPDSPVQCNLPCPYVSFDRTWHDAIWKSQKPELPRYTAEEIAFCEEIARRMDLMSTDSSNFNPALGA